VHVGQETLDTLGAAQRLNRWLFEQIREGLGDRVLEIGSGVGNMTQFLLSKKLVVASDIDARHLERLRRRFVEGERLRVMHVDAARIDPDQLRPLGIDTVMGLNVLEHVEDDGAALARMHALLPPEGRLALLVPALPSLFSSLDRSLDHHRRYSRKDLEAKLQRAGFQVESLRYFNVPGILGWWLNGRILKRRALPGNQVRLFDLLVPLFRLEQRFGPPFGLSLIAIARKP
ncbi:MAG: class I SAM-dependent methyltransferase, partial [Myxococcota bacterium]